MQILRKIWAIYSLPQISADAATGLAQLDANGCVDVPNLTNSSSQVLHELISKSFAPMREAATAAYHASPLAKLVCNVAPDDLQVPTVQTKPIDVCCKHGPQMQPWKIFNLSGWLPHRACSAGFASAS